MLLYIVFPFLHADFSLLKTPNTGLITSRTPLTGSATPASSRLSTPRNLYPGDSSTSRSGSVYTYLHEAVKAYIEAPVVNRLCLFAVVINKCRKKYWLTQCLHSLSGNPSFWVRHITINLSALGSVCCRKWCLLHSVVRRYIYVQQLSKDL